MTQRRGRKEAVRDIILGLHEGLSVEEARDRFQQEVGHITSSEIADIEQSLIDDGMSPDEIKKFCNVHALLFESALTETGAGQETHPAHPVHLFTLENRRIEELSRDLKRVVNEAGSRPVSDIKKEVGEILGVLRGVETHYTRKEQVLFPYLERYGFEGPSKVMWGKHNEVREMLKSSLSALHSVSSSTGLETFIEDRLNPLLEEVEGMVFKEEHILFPTAMEKLSSSDWVEILKESEEVGYVFIEEPPEATHLIQQLKKSIEEEPVIKGTTIEFPTGQIEVSTLMNILNTLPVELTFVDKEDTVRYFSDHSDRIFVRTRSVLGRKVQNCHPPQSLELVERILADFRAGIQDQADFWLEFGGGMVYIKFIAVRNDRGEYEGTLEITQKVEHIRTLKGEKRLLDQGN